MIDIGVNFINKSFRNDCDEVIHRAVESGVEKMIVTGTSVSVSEKSLELAKRFPGILYSTAGIHPHDAKTFNSESLSSLSKLLENEEVLAVGECGLDFNRDFSPRDKQEECFRALIELAVELEKPLFLHQRDAHEKFMSILADYDLSRVKVVVHCFTGSQKEAMDCLAAGFFIGMTGWICDERRGFHLKEFVADIPLDRLMIETDCPYLLPRNLRPKPKKGRNEPAFLGHIANEIAECYKLPVENFKKEVEKTTKSFFGLA